jgi:hypothetical protein
MGPGDWRNDVKVVSSNGEGQGILVVQTQSRPGRPHWKEAMDNEMRTWSRACMWETVSRQTGRNVGLLSYLLRLDTFPHQSPGAVTCWETTTGYGPW